MASIIPGFEYDIFISYRQKDNRSDHWVTIFVQALRDELDATFKEEISIYFDSNPHDGLLETHDVDGSLKEKIKCLIFIPIVSQTYCDPKAFAWQNEFLAFIDFAKKDEFGLDIKLPNGNVTKRVLPVRIHEIDEVDKKLFEKTLGGVLRPVDFIYKARGVNRPLNLNEIHPDDNVNRTIYKDQINKVANAIKNIVHSISQPAQASSDKWQSNIVRLRKRSIKTLSGISVSIILVALISFFFIPRWLEKFIIDNAEESIAVIPFVNLSGDPSQEYFSDGLSEELLNLLGKIPHLQVIARTSSFSFKNKNEDIRVIGQRLGVAHLLTGSVRKSNNKLRITARLVSANTGTLMWTETFDRELDDIFKIQDEIGQAIVNALRLVMETQNGNVLESQATDLNAYQIYFKARQQLAERGKSLLEAKQLFEEVIKIDSNYAPAYSGLARTLSIIPVWLYTPMDDAIIPSKQAAFRAIALDSSNAEAYSVLGYITSLGEWNWELGEKYFEKSVELRPNDSEILNFLGDFYSVTMNEKGIKTEKLALKFDPLQYSHQFDLARIWFNERQYQNAIDAFALGHKLDSTRTQGVYRWVEAFIRLSKIQEAERVVDIFRKSGLYERLHVIDARARIALAKGQKEDARMLIEKLLIATESGDYSYSHIAAIYLGHGMYKEASRYITKAADSKDLLLTFMPVDLSVPEDMPDDHDLQTALTHPLFRDLFEIRRRNLNVNKGN